MTNKNAGDTQKKQNNHSRRKQLMLFHGYYQDGKQIEITASQDGKGFQNLAPVYFSTN